MANQVRVRRKQLGLTQEKVATRIGTTKATVMKLEKGMMQLTENWLKRLSVPLECRPEDLIAEEIPQDVPVVGEVANRGELRFFRELPMQRGAAEPGDDFFRGLDRVQRPPECGYRNVMALQVKDNALEPFLSAGSYIYYAQPVFEHFDVWANQLVVCSLSKGELEVGRLLTNDSFGHFDLKTLNGETLTAIKLEWAAKVIFLKP